MSRVDYSWGNSAIIGPGIGELGRDESIGIIGEAKGHRVVHGIREEDDLDIPFPPIVIPSVNGCSIQSFQLDPPLPLLSLLSLLLLDRLAVVLVLVLLRSLVEMLVGVNGSAAAAAGIANPSAAFVVAADVDG